MNNLKEKLCVSAICSILGTCFGFGCTYIASWIFNVRMTGLTVWFFIWLSCFLVSFMLMQFNKNDKNRQL